ncbi:MAG TPA: response regulator [Acidiferrobacterales bacterium]|nr:response regulator [Acidiferrobacterales bacterium]
MPRSALIVDDSRTALASLNRLLKERDVPADLVESGPEALNYLRGNSPGVIFLDHMMPGMDGFETLAAIKSNARTAAIPVVMYTSREGEAYMGQALLLGAFDVLQKPVDPDELGQILKRIDQLRTPQASPVEEARTTSGTRLGPAPGDNPPRPDTAVTGVIHIPHERRRARPGVPPGDAATEGGNKRGKQTWWIYARRALVTLVLLLPGAWLFERYQQAERLREQLQQENLELRAEQRVARELAAARESSQQQHIPVTPPQRGLQQARRLLDTVTWALNQHGQYGLDDEALGDARLALLRELIARLAAAGFQGTVRLETHIGEFCLVRDEQGDPREPGDSLSFSRCEVVSYPPEQAVQLSRRQSPAFARYLAERRPGNPIQITLVPHGATRPLAPYPDVASVQTAGDWNRIARLNQRVEIVLSPVP